MLVNWFFKLTHFSCLGGQLENAEGARNRRKRNFAAQAEVLLLRQEHRLARPRPAEPLVRPVQGRYNRRHSSSYC